MRKARAGRLIGGRGRRQARRSSILFAMPAAWPTDRHEFPVAWYPSGRYLTVTVEEPNHPGNSVSATPGYGGYSNTGW